MTASRNKSRQQGRSTDELLVFYVPEAFLRCLAHSPHAEIFTLEGGLLLTTLDARRPTRDRDPLAEIGRNRDDVLSCTAEIVTVDVDDGVIFVPSEVRSVVIREGDQYEDVMSPRNATRRHCSAIVVAERWSPGRHRLAVVQPVHLVYPADCRH